MTAPRPVHPDELPQLGRLLDAVFRLPRGVTDQHMLSDFPLLFRPDNLSNCRVIFEGGKIVSHAGLWPREMVVDGTVLNVGVLVAVATHPDCRRRGYAARIVADLQRTLHDDGFDLGILWTGVPAFYEKLGWQKVTPGGYVVPLDEVELAQPSAAAEGFDIVPYNPEQHLDPLLALNEAEPVRMTRPRDDLAVLLSLPKIAVTVAMHGDRLAACLVSSRAVNKPGLIECRGATDAILALLADALLNGPPSEPARWLISPTRDDLAKWAKQQGWPLHPLVSSKGMANEMILACKPDSVPQHVRERLFVWGLDLA